ncbi:uncharacterized protein [Aegilops tauschii subsp. strangulata]|uniref:uncharacterized protein n=1 Tax=Aegilops tauschii subsp. strangulata TaxID=200361 RepID=UPI003CC8A568
MPLHIMMAMALTPPILKQLNRLVRSFLWRGRKEANGGHLLFNWCTVCRPISLGGLGIPDFQRAGIALRTRWLWLQATDPSRHWHHLHMPSCLETQAIFRAATSWALGDGRSCRVWVDPWLDIMSIAELALLIFAKVSRRRCKIPSFRDALADRSWARDISGSLGPAALFQYVHLW